jgi:hypothetical protein
MVKIYGSDNQELEDGKRNFYVKIVGYEGETTIEKRD